MPRCSNCRSAGSDQRWRGGAVGGTEPCCQLVQSVQRSGDRARLGLVEQVAADGGIPDPSIAVERPDTRGDVDDEPEFGVRGGAQVPLRPQRRPLVGGNVQMGERADGD